MAVIAVSRRALTSGKLRPSMNRLGLLVPTVALAALLSQPSAAQQSGATRTVIDVSKLGPQVGQVVPDFSLKDQAGKTWTRQSIMGPRGAMLVFFRSADW